MKSDFDSLVKAQQLMMQALGVAGHSLPNNPNVSEAKIHMRQAITQLEQATKSQIRKKETQQTEYEKWWKNIEVNASEAKMAQVGEQTYIRTLDLLNAMINEEQRKLQELEQNVKSAQQANKLISD